MWAYSKLEQILPFVTTNWRDLLFLPFLNLVLIVIFWQSQIFQYAHSSKGVLYMWLLAGLLFLLIQLSLLLNGWQKTKVQATEQKQLKTQWLLASQITLFTVAAIYNIIALVQLTLLGIRPTTPYDLLIIIILIITGTLGAILYKRNFASPQARLLYATGTKAVPQWLQALGFVFLGSSGMHSTTLGAIVAMGSLRFHLAKQSAKALKDDTTQAAYQAALRDLISIGAMGVGWVIGRM